MKATFSKIKLRHGVIVAVVVAAMLVFVLTADNARILSGGSLRQITAWSDESGARTLPDEQLKIAGAVYRISTVLPAGLSARDCLIFRTENLPVTVLLGNETLYQTQTPQAHQTIGDEWHMLPLASGAEGQTVTILSTILYKNGSNFISTVYLGDKADFLQLQIRRQMPHYIVSVLLALLGLALLATGVLLGGRFKVNMPLSFALLSMVLGVWMATQTEIPELLWGKTPVLRFFTYSPLPFATVLICFFLRSLSAPKWVRSAYLWVGVSQIAQGILAIAAEALHVAAYVETLPYTRMAMLLVCLPFAFQLPGLLREFQKHFYLLLGFFCLAAMILADLASVYSGVYDYARNTRFGLLLMAVLISLQSVVQVRQSLRVVDEAELMRRLAYKDSLTGMNNRLALVRDQEMLLTRKSGCVGIVQMDVNNLKETNDRYGHDAGDALLIRAARAIHSAFDPYGQSYRVGGDEFVALLIEPACDITLNMCRERLEHACEEQNVNQEYLLSIAMGYAVFNPALGGRFYDLVRMADMRMYERKREMKAMQTPRNVKP